MDGSAGRAHVCDPPDSLYMPGKPAFFGANTWPWVNPNAGATYTLPAKARFDAGTPNTVP